MKSSSTNRPFNLCFLLAFGLAFWPIAVRAQTPIACGQTIAGSITASGKTNQYSFAGTNGESVILSFANYAGSWSPVVDVRNPGGTLIVELTADAATNVVLAASGTYTFLVHDASYTATGSYALSIQSPLDGGCESAPITCGQTFYTTVTESSQMQACGFAGTNGQSVIFSFANYGGNWSAIADVYNPAGTRIFQLPVNAATNVVLAATGTYTFLIHDSAYLNGGSFALSIQTPLGGGCDSVPITCGQTFFTNVAYSSQMQACGFAGTNGQSVIFSFANYYGGWSAVADVYNPAGTRIFQLPVNAATNVVLAASGTYTLLIHDATYLLSGDYAISVQTPLDGGCDSVPISCGQTFYTNIAYSSQMQACGFVGTSGESVIFSFDNYAGGWSPVADVYNPAGTRIFQLPVDAATNVVLAASGTYTLLIHDSAYLSVGSFALSIQSPLDGGCNTTPIACGQTGSGDISLSAQIDAYLIMGCSGELVQLSTSGFSGSQFDLYDPTGNKLFSIGPSTSSNITFSVSGSYTLLVHASNYGGTGGYSVTLTCSNGCSHTTSTSSSPPNGGSTSGGGTYNCCFAVTVCETPASCYNFENWTVNGNVVSTSSCYTFTPTNNPTLTANFAPTAGRTNQICGVQVEGTNVAVSGQSVRGDNYQLQTRNSLLAGSWSNIAGVVLSNSPGGLIVLTNFGGALPPQKFYRFDITP